MKRLATGFALALALSSAGAAQEKLTLEVGAAHTLAASEAVRQVVISTAGVVTTDAPSARKVRLTGVAPGQAEVTLVTARSRRSYALTVEPARAVLARGLEEQLKREPGLEKITVRPGAKAYRLGGEAEGIAPASRAVAAAEALAGEAVVDEITVTGRQMVAVDVKFVAISDSTLKALGFNFANLGQGFQWAAVGPNNLTSFYADAAGLGLEVTEPFSNAFNILLHDRSRGITGVVSALADAGLSQVLAQPTLMARSGEAAEFLAGGDIPIPVPQAGGTGGVITIEYRPYGVRLSVEPYVLESGRIVLKLAPEVSELDYTNAVRIQGFNVPGFRRRSASTTVELGDGQSFVIAGLTYAASASNESKMPGLGELPVIGALFKTAQQRREKQELVIIATPRLVSPLDPTDLADLDLPTPPGPAVADIILNRNPTEQRAARIGLSR